MACQFFLFKNYIKNVKGFNQVGNSSPSNSILRIHFLQFRKQIWKAIWEQRCFEVPWIKYQDFDIRKNWLTSYSWHIHPAVFFVKKKKYGSCLFESFSWYPSCLFVNTQVTLWLKSFQTITTFQTRHLIGITMCQSKKIFG